MGQRLLRGDRKGLENPKLPEVLGGSLGFLLCCPFQIFFSDFLILEKSSWDSDVERVWSFFALHLLYAIWMTSVNIILMKHSGSQVGWYPWCSNLCSNVSDSEEKIAGTSAHWLLQRCCTIWVFRTQEKPKQAKDVCTDAWLRKEKAWKGNSMFREDCVHEHVIIRNHLIFHIVISTLLLLTKYHHIIIFFHSRFIAFQSLRVVFVDHLCAFWHKFRECRVWPSACKSLLQLFWKAHGIDLAW